MKIYPLKRRHPCIVTVHHGLNLKPRHPVLYRPECVEAIFFIRPPKIVDKLDIRFGMKWTKDDRPLGYRR
jgi:hypothetical protein